MANCILKSRSINVTRTYYNFTIGYGNFVALWCSWRNITPYLQLILCTFICAFYIQTKYKKQLRCCRHSFVMSTSNKIVSHLLWEISQKQRSAWTLPLVPHFPLPLDIKPIRFRDDFLELDTTSKSLIHMNLQLSSNNQSGAWINISPWTIYVLSFQRPQSPRSHPKKSNSHSADWRWSKFLTTLAKSQSIDCKIKFA